MTALVIGRVVRPHGIRGEVVVEVHTDSPEERFAIGSAVETDPAGAGPLRISEVRFGRAGYEGGAKRGRAGDEGGAKRGRAGDEGRAGYMSRLLVRFDGVADRDAAEALRGVYLLVDSANVPEPEDPDEFHDHQLVGLRAQTPAGDDLGTVVRIEHAPASDLLVVARPDGRSALVPFVKAIVPEVDLPAGRLVVTPPEGLLDL